MKTRECQKRAKRHRADKRAFDRYVARHPEKFIRKFRIEADTTKP